MSPCSAQITGVSLLKLGGIIYRKKYCVYRQLASCKNFTLGVACLATQGSTVSSGVPFRANAGLTYFLTGSLRSELPLVT